MRVRAYHDLLQLSLFASSLALCGAINQGYCATTRFDVLVAFAYWFRKSHGTPLGEQHSTPSTEAYVSSQSPAS